MNSTDETTVPNSVSEKLNEAVRELGVRYVGEAGAYLAFLIPGLDKMNREEQNAIAADLIETIIAVEDPDVAQYVKNMDGIIFD